MRGSRVLRDPQISNDRDSVKSKDVVPCQVRARTTSFPAHTPSSKKLLQRAACQQLVGHSARSTVARCAGWRRSTEARAAAAATNVSPSSGPPAAPSNSAQTGGDQPGRKCTEEMPRSLCLAAPRGSFGDPPNKSQKAKRVQIERPQNPKTALARLEFLRIIRRPEPCSSRPLAQDDDAGLSTSLCACAWRLILHTISRRTHHSHTPLLTPPPLPPCPGCPGGPGGPGCFGRVSAELPRGFHRPSIDLHHLHPRPADGPRVAIPLNLLYSRLPDETLDGLQRSCVPASCA